MRIIVEEGAKLSFISQPAKTKYYWPKKILALLKPLTNEF